jgi:hypothetical protein
MLLLVITGAFALGFTAGMLLVAILASVHARWRRAHPLCLQAPHGPASAPASLSLRTTCD